MDCIGVGWMTWAINRSRHQLGTPARAWLGARFWCLARWARFSIEILIYYSRHNTLIYTKPLYVAPERQWMAAVYLR
jgi:hypothetical protein